MGGTFQAAGGTLTGVHLSGSLNFSADSETLAVVGGLAGAATSIGTISLDDEGDALKLYGSQSLNDVDVNIDNGTGLSLYDTSGSATFTLGSALTLSASGSNGITFESSGETLINRGTLSGSSGLLYIRGNQSSDDAFKNIGEVSASSEEEILFDNVNIAVGSFADFSTTYGGIVAVGVGTITNTHNTLSLGSTKQLTLFGGGVVQGGVIDDTGGGLISTAGTLSSVSYAGTLALQTGNTLFITNSFTIATNGGAGVIDLGGGILNFDLPTLNRVGISSQKGGLIYFIGESTTTLGSAVNITGVGLNIGSANSTLVNNGSIISDGNGNVDIGSNSNDTFVNNGTFSATNGGTIMLEAVNFAPNSLKNFSTAGGGVVELTGNLMNQGETLSLGSNRQLTLDALLGAKGNITGGTIADPGGDLISKYGTLSGVNYNGVLDLTQQDAAVDIEDGFTISSASGAGTINVTGNDSRLTFINSQSLSNAKINLAGGNLNFQVTNGNGTLSLADSVDINISSGYANIQSQDSTISSQGLIDVSTASLSIFGAFSNAGTISVNQGSLTVSNAFSGTGIVELSSSSKVSLMDGASAGQTIDFSAPTGDLALQDPLLFDGSILGFGGSDVIDLLSTSASGSSYNDGLLTVTNGTTTIAQLDFQGHYSQNDFALASDGGDGTLIKFV